MIEWDEWTVQNKYFFADGIRTWPRFPRSEPDDPTTPPVTKQILYRSNSQNGAYKQTTQCCGSIFVDGSIPFFEETKFNGIIQEEGSYSHFCNLNEIMEYGLHRGITVIINNKDHKVTPAPARSKHTDVESVVDEFVLDSGDKIQFVFKKAKQ